MSNYTNGPEPTDRIALLVLGMHRSGTSALTRVLSLLGADLPANLFAAHPSNPTGHWESLDWIALHDEVLSKYGRSWDSPLPLPKEASRPKTLAPFCARLAALLCRDFSNSKMFVAKDPRLCRLLPLWRKALADVGFAPRYILMVRHPLEVAASLAIRNQLSSTAALLLWMRHLIESERETRGEPRIFVSYDALLNDWQSVAARIAERFNLQWPVKPPDAAAQVNAFLRHDLRHHFLNGDSELEEYAWPKALYSAAPGSFDEAQVTTFDEIGRNLVEFDRYVDPVVLEYRDQCVKSLSAEVQRLRVEKLQPQRTQLPTRSRNFWDLLGP